MSEGVERNRIRLNVGKGMLDLLVEADEFDSRKTGFVGPSQVPHRVLAKYRKLIGLAATGAVCG